jgi:predicted DNA-binding WGR domain protein
MKQYLINQTGDSNKFWTIEQLQNSHTVEWGRVGAKGRVNTKQFDNALDCSNDVQKLINEKIGKGNSIIDNEGNSYSIVNHPIKPMDETVFWKIIDLFNWEKSENDDLVVKPAIKKLASMSIDDIYIFSEILSEKLYILDGIDYAKNCGDSSYINDTEYFSVDAFLYSRCCVVANGKDFFYQVLNDPTQMPKDLEFEAILYLPDEAYNKKTKSEDFDYETKFSVETFSNKEGWIPKVNAKKIKWKFWGK